jgi:hypothetical protein
MSEQTHFEAFVDHIISDDDSALGKMKAERDYALHCLEREIAICSQTQARNDALVTELKLIADWRNVSLAGEYEHSLRDIIRSMLDCADRALASIKEPS